MELGNRNGQIYALCGWPNGLEMTRDALEEADPRLVVRHGNRVCYSAANGRAAYYVTRDLSWLPTIRLQLVASVYKPAEWAASAQGTEAR